MKLGISVVLCCHNSAQELPKTLDYLAAQEVGYDLPWEVIVIDNASQDETSKVALESWPPDKAAVLRVVHEPQLGLMHARYRALAEAQYEIISFIDDDNWVCPKWVRTASEIMSQHPEVGACGGESVPAFDGKKPDWFDLSSRSYAIGTQGPEGGGDITDSRGRLIGAGLTIRKSAWQQLVDNGFDSLLVGCKGKAITRGEDTELTFALVLAGWRLWYEPKLKLQHHLQAERLHWAYLRRLRRNGGKATIGFDPYRFAFEQQDGGSSINFWWKVGRFSSQDYYRQTWGFQLAAVLKEILKTPIKFILSRFLSMEGDREVLKLEMKIGRFIELINKRKDYDVSIQAVRDSAWRKKTSPPKIASVK